MDLILIRHGLPEISRESSDPPLSAVGRAQAGRVAEALSRERIDAVWSSTMKRAAETAAPFAGAAGHEVRVHDGLCEYDRRSGVYIPDEVLKVENYEAWKAMASGASGHDLETFQGQVVAGLEDIIRAHPGDRVAVFCHGGVINVWTAHVLGLPAKLFFNPNYTSINRFACARSGARGLVSLNDHAHLFDLAVEFD